FVMPEHIQYVAFPVLNHRIILTADRELEGYDPKLVIKEMISHIEVPR
ncbi:MAG: magnesium chelatase, partial [Phaeodactylibacter sp.]|nr:magnesium chelatase [Phaeodactylibacter sp.]